MCLIYLSTEVDEVGVSHGRGRVCAGGLRPGVLLIYFINTSHAGEAGARHDTYC